MEKIKITEEQDVHNQWYIDAKSQTKETLPEFIRHLTEDYEHDYGTICHAAAAAAIAAAWTVDSSEQGGITGFQAGTIMWQYIRHWMYENNKLGMKIVNYDDLLFPQYERKFEKTITNHQWEKLQQEAKEKLKNINGVSLRVVDHWKKISEGNVPFGFTILHDEE